MYMSLYQNIHLSQTNILCVNNKIKQVQKINDYILSPTNNTQEVDIKKINIKIITNIYK